MTTSSCCNSLRVNPMTTSEPDRKESPTRNLSVQNKHYLVLSEHLIGEPWNIANCPNITHSLVLTKAF